MQKKVIASLSDRQLEDYSNYLKNGELFTNFPCDNNLPKLDFETRAKSNFIKRIIDLSKGEIDGEIIDISITPEQNPETGGTTFYITVFYK